MSMRNPLRSFSASRAILILAAGLVPRKRRTEWLAEWLAELWHVWQICHSGADVEQHGEKEVTTFCLGAFKDALWIRKDESRSTSRRLFLPGSPSRCAVLLATLSAAFLLLGFSLPGVRKVLPPLPYSEGDGLRLVSARGNDLNRWPSVQLGDYQDWPRIAHHLFSEFAFYQTLQNEIHIGAETTAKLSIARGSQNLLQLLNIPVSAEGAEIAAGRHSVKVVLSRSAWQRYFHGDRQIFGREIEIAGEQAEIVGVASDQDWRLPGMIDAWVLEDPQRLAALPSRTLGYVIARVVPGAFPEENNGRWRMTIFRGGNRYDLFDCLSLAEQARQPLSIFLFTLLLACLALPATTSLPLGEYPAHRGRMNWTTQLRRWVFLSSKLLWIVAVVYCGSLDLAYCRPSLGVAGSQYIQLASSFPALLFAFRWALRDQRRRCPVCLRSLTNPARVGQSSRSFLAWNGTELVCLEGHGLLHVPDVPTSWFSTQRWLYLDPSWSGLFSGGYLVSAGMG